MFSPGKSISSTFFRGVTTVFPIVVTIYVVWICFDLTESLVKKAVLLAIDESQYFVGLGIAISIALVFFVGILVRVSPIRWLVHIVEERIMSIPLAKSIYGSTKDVLNLFSEDTELNTPVLVNLGQPIGEVLGFVTCPSPGEKLELDLENKVAVYLPMSYQLGGYTLIVSKDQLSDITLKKEDALRFILTAGVSESPKNGKSDKS